MEKKVIFTLIENFLQVMLPPTGGMADKRVVA